MNWQGERRATRRGRRCMHVLTEQMNEQKNWQKKERRRKERKKEKREKKGIYRLKVKRGREPDGRRESAKKNLLKILSYSSLYRVYRFLEDD